MLIAISQRIDFLPNRNEYRDALDQRLLRLVVELGHTPVQVPNVLFFDNDFKELLNWLNKINPDGFILSGGNDIGEFKNRDETEKKLYKWATNNEKPILGICRGMQLIGVLNGVKLKPVSNHVNTEHPIFLNHQNDKSQIRNSYHNYALENCPKEFQILHLSQDGEIESIKHLSKKIIGIMWHPERNTPFLVDDIKLLKYIFSV